MARKKKICLVFCGGTIAMSKNPETGTLEPAHSPEDLLSMVPKVKDLIDLDFVQVLNVDSTNIVAKDWTKVAISIYERYDQYDGFLVTHGTDTMAYTASALAFSLQNLNKPIVITGAQASPDSIGSDAPFNLENAFRVVTSDLAEVVISFGHHVLRGVRSRKRHEADFNAFDSPAFPELATIRSELHWSPFVKRIRTYGTHSLQFNPDFSEGVLNVRLNAGLTADMIRNLIQSKMIKGIIFESLGAGNVPACQLPIIKEAVELNIPVLVTSPFVGGSTACIGTYKTGLDALKAGAIPSGDMTFEAASVKLMWSLAQFEKNANGNGSSKSELIPYIRKMFERDFVGEISLGSQD